jgi:hypothetical protein
MKFTIEIRFEPKEESSIEDVLELMKEQLEDVIAMAHDEGDKITIVGIKQEN